MRAYHLIVVSLLFSCTAPSDGGLSLPPDGTERGPCYGNGTCDEGLVCLSDRCVVWDADVAPGPDNEADTEAEPDSADVDEADNEAAQDVAEDPAADAAPDVADVDTEDTTQDSGPDVPRMLAVPRDLTAVVVEAGVVLTWVDESEGESGFEVQRRGADEQWTLAATVDADTERATDTAAPAGQSLRYRVRAVGEPAPSDWSQEATVETPPGTPTFEDDIVPILYRSCGAGNATCHSRHMYAANADRGCRGWLSLEDAEIGAFVYDEDDQPTRATGCPDVGLYERLTEIKVWQCGGDWVTGRFYAVVPGDLDHSYLWRKIAGGPYCEIGQGDERRPSSEMPPGLEMPADELEAIRAWILAGAPRSAQ